MTILSVERKVCLVRLTGCSIMLGYYGHAEYLCVKIQTALIIRADDGNVMYFSKKEHGYIILLIHK